MAAKKSQTRESAKTLSSPAKRKVGSMLTALPGFDPQANAFEYQKVLVNDNFSNVEWSVRGTSASPDRSLTDYDVDHTEPDAGTFLDPAGIVQVIVFLPPQTGGKKK